MKEQLDYLISYVADIGAADGLLEYARKALSDGLENRFRPIPATTVLIPKKR